MLKFITNFEIFDRRTETQEVEQLKTKLNKNSNLTTRRLTTSTTANKLSIHLNWNTCLPQNRTRIDNEN